MSEAQVADNKKPADATPAAEKPAAAAATDTASASTKLLDACDNKPAETKAEASSTAADTTAKESAPTVKEDHVDTLLRGDQNSDGDDDDKTTSCQREYLDSVKQGAKPAEAQNTAKLPDLAIKEEQVKDLPKDSKQVGGDEKSGYKVFEGPDGKRYFQKGNGQFTVLELSADGKRYEGTSEQGHKKVVMDKINNDSEAVKVFDDKGKQVESFEPKKEDGGGNIFRRGLNFVNDNVFQPVAKVANDYVVQPINDHVVQPVVKAAVDIFSDETYDFSTNSKDLVQPPAPPEDYKWLDDITVSDDSFWDFSKESNGAGEWDDSIWNEFDPTFDPTKSNKVFTGTDGTEVTKSADGKYTLKYDGKDIELQEEKKKIVRNGEEKEVSNYVTTLENGQKVTYSDWKGGVTVGDTQIARSDTSARINDLPPGSTKIVDSEGRKRRGGEESKFDVFEGPDGTRYFQNRDGGYTTMKVSADGKVWEGRLENGDRVVMDKNNPDVKYTVYDNEGDIKMFVDRNNDIHRKAKPGNGDVDQQERVFSDRPPPNEEEFDRVSRGISTYNHDGKETTIVKKDDDNWIKSTKDENGLEQIVIRRDGHNFARDKDKNWVDADTRRAVHPEVAAKLQEMTQKGIGNIAISIDPETGNSSYRIYQTEAQKIQCEEAAANNQTCVAPVMEGTIALGESRNTDNTRNETEIKTKDGYQVIDSQTGEAQFGLRTGEGGELEFYTGTGKGPNDFTLSEEKGFWDSSGAGMDAQGNIYDEDGYCVYDQGWSGGSDATIREQEYKRSEAVGEAEMGKASSMISPARGVIYGAFDPATAESLCSAAYAGLSGAINLAMSCGNIAMAGELMSKQSEAATWISISANARKATTQRAHEIPGGGGGMGFLMAQAARDTASGVGSTTAFNKMLAIADPTNPRVAHLTGYNPISLTWTEGRGDNNNRAA